MIFPRFSEKQMKTILTLCASCKKLDENEIIYCLLVWILHNILYVFHVEYQYVEEVLF